MTSHDTSAQREQNKRTVRRLYEECVNGARPELLPELVAADYVGPQGERGPAGFGRTVDSLRSGVPDIHFTLADLVAEGDRVAVRWTWTGTHTGTLRGLPPSHTRVTNEGIAMYALRDGRVTGGWLQTDRLGLLQQIGVVPADVGARTPAAGPTPPGQKGAGSPRPEP